MTLKAQHQKFITEYLKCYNATKAAIAAGYSEDSAHVTGHRLLKKANISAELDRVYRENLMSATEVLHHLSQIGRGDFADLVDSNGNPDFSKAVRAGKSNLIKRIKQKSITTSDKDGEGTDIFDTEVESYDRLKALELLAKYHDLINRSTVKVQDWRDEIIHLLRTGKVSPEQVESELGNGLAEELFVSAGIRIAHGGEGGAS